MKINSKMNLYSKIVSAISDAAQRIYEQKQIQPFTSNENGVCHIVTTDAVGYNLEILQKDIERILRDLD